MTWKEWLLYYFEPFGIYQKCVFCRQVFRSDRSSAKLAIYCSSECQQAAHGLRAEDYLIMMIHSTDFSWYRIVASALMGAVIGLAVAQLLKFLLD